MKRLFAAMAIVGTGVVSATSALAHQLNVFAFVEDGVVIVESRFPNGNLPQVGEVSVLDGDGAELMLLPLETDGTVQFPLDPAHADTGLLIEVRTGEGHDNYWILTPDEIARGSGS